MESFLFYIGKVAIAAGAFYLVFLVLFQNQKHFGFNRIYLPVSMLLSFLIPLITFTTVQYVEPPTFDFSSFAAFENTAVESVQPSFVPEWYHYLFGMYLLGGIGFLLFLITGHFKAFQIIRKSTILQLFESWVNVTRKDVHPFSFFNKIVLSEKTLTSENLQMIVNHEKIHVTEKHTLDILFVEILFLFQWFNPFAWLLKDAVKNNLEYKTDHKIAQQYNPQKYQMAMVALADKKGVAPFLTALNGSQLKNRIIMMKKKTENKFTLVKQLLVLPLLSVLIMGLSARELKTEYLPQQATKTSATANLVIIVDGQVIPADSEKFSQFDFSKEFDGGKIIKALELDESEIEISALSFNENSKEFRFFVRTNGYVEGSNAEFDEMTKKQDDGIQATKPSKTLYAIDGHIKTMEEIGNFDNYSFESLVVLDGKSATDKYGNIAIDASVMEFKTGEAKVKVTSAGKTEIENDTIKNTNQSEIKVIGYGQNNGENTQIRIRASSSSTGEGKPLFIVDGKEVENAEDINPDSIKSMSVLKGETATTLYGEKAKDGAILITLKKPGDSTSEITKEGVKVVGYGISSDANQQIRIRATGSTAGAGKPLVIVDGKEVENADNISTENIESMSVLKDVTATALYGEKAKDGVIIITTKSNDPKNNPLYFINGNKVDQKAAFNYSAPNQLVKEIVRLNSEDAIKKYGSEGKNGAVEIYLKENPTTIDKFFSSGSADKQPLVFVDGKKIQSINEIDPNYISSITRIIDVFAIEKYGEAGKNGVIEVILKKPEELKLNELPVVLDGKITGKKLNEFESGAINKMNKVEPKEAVKKYGDFGKFGVLEITSHEK